MPRRDAVVGVADVGVTEAAAGDFDDDVVRGGDERGELDVGELALGGGEAVAVSTVNAHARMVGSHPNVSL
jgi:hypothetical protein